MDATLALVTALTNYMASQTMFDMDGVLCHEFKGTEPRLSVESRLPMSDPYSIHLCNAEPLHIPKKPIFGIVTGRLKRYRDMTQAWLDKHGVKTINGVWMSPLWEHSPELRENNPASKMKGIVYLHHPEATLFVESKIKHAKVIVQLSGKAVLCTEDYKMYEP